MVFETGELVKVKKYSSVFISATFTHIGISAQTMYLGFESTIPRSAMVVIGLSLVTMTP